MPYQMLHLAAEVHICYDPRRPDDLRLAQARARFVLQVLIPRLWQRTFRIHSGEGCEERPKALPGGAAVIGSETGRRTTEIKAQRCSCAPNLFC